MNADKFKCSLVYVSMHTKYAVHIFILELKLWKFNGDRWLADWAEQRWADCGAMARRKANARRFRWHGMAYYGDSGLSGYSIAEHHII